MIDLDTHIKTAMKAKDAVALTAYRSLKQHVMRKLNEPGRTSPALTEAEFVALAKREVKERAEANTFLKPEDATYQENARIMSILEGHLPKAMDAEAQDAAVRKAIADTGAAGVKDFGKVMGALKQVSGLDMGAASARVKALLESK
jgi:uncharacterized protein YqeY